jgi:hypothetical protein
VIGIIGEQEKVRSPAAHLVAVMLPNPTDNTSNIESYYRERRK